LENQVLRKASDINYDTEWVDASFGGGGTTGPQGPTGPTGATGPAGVVAATAPITYNSGTQTVSTSLATNRILGRSTAGTGVAEEITIGSGLSLSGGALSATGGGGGSTSASDLTSGTLANARLTTRVRASANVFMWSSFR
jgi:hypothetical protein